MYKPREFGTATAIEFVNGHIFLAHCEYLGLNSLPVTRLPVLALVSEALPAAVSSQYVVQSPVDIRT